MKNVLVVLGDGFEEIEVVTPVDILRRAGCQVTVAGIAKKELTGAHAIRIVADTIFDPASGLPDAIIIPGGPGAGKLGQNRQLLDYIARCFKAGKTVAAICAAPAEVLAPSGVLDGKRATCFPGCEKKLGPKICFVEDRVVVDGNVITGRGPGTAFEFAIELVKQLVSESEARRIAGQTLMR